MKKQIKAKSLGPVESVCMKRSGRKDGKEGLPCPDDKKIWHSPLMDRECERYSEFCEKAWGNLQTEVEDSYVELANLVDLAIMKERQLHELEETLDKAALASPGNETLSARKHGEEDLLESQVRARRLREEQKRLAPLKGKIALLEDELGLLKTDISKMANQIYESQNTTRLQCETVMIHTRQRLCVYWYAAYLHHPDRNKMPVSYEFDLASPAESTYLSQHRNLIAEVTRIIGTQKESEVA